MIANEIAERRRAEEALRESEDKLRQSEQRLKQLVSNCPAALYTCKASGDYGATFVSETITSQTGYETQEFIDDPSFWANHVHPDDRERIFAEMSKLSEEDQISNEYRFLHKDGTYRWMHDQSSILPETDGKPREIVGFWKDITQRKQAEEKLRESEARLAEAERVGRIGHWDWNVVTAESHLSAEYCRIFGVEPSESGLTLDTFLDLVHPDDCEHVRSETAIALDKHDRYTIEYRIIRPCGEERVINSEAKISRGQDGRPLRIFGVVQDITERKQVEQKQQAAELRYRTLFEQSPDAVMLIDPDTTRSIEFNDLAPKLLGYTREEFAQLRGSDYESMEGFDDIRKHHERVLRDGRSEFETCWRTKHGETRDVVVSIRLIEVDGRKVFHNVVRDITHQVRTREQMRKQEMELAHVARLSTMGEMGTGLAHELNQPLAAIANYCTALQLSFRNGDALERARIDEMLECVRQQSLRAGEIIRRLRVQVGKRAPVRSRVDVTHPIREVLQLLEPELRQSDVRVVQRVNHSDRVSIIDEIQIQQVLVNLIRNSLDSMSETDHDQRTLEITTSETDDDLIQVSVSDTGKGISTEFSNQVFDAFFSSKSEGMGMGLAISRTIIENHGGRLCMMPNVERGATFYFRLPIAKEGSDDVA